MPHPFRLWLPIVPLLVGIALSIWRFRADDPLAGLGLGLFGVCLTVVAAIRVPPQAPPR